MKRLPNPELDRLILNHLADKYQLYQFRQPGEFHLSSGVYCTTKAFWEATTPVIPTDEELMLFAVGLGLQDMLTPKQATTPTFVKDGIIFRPDFMLKLYKDEYHELKTTRMSMKRILEGLPDTWVQYIAGGCYIRGVTTYQLSTLLLMGNWAPPFPKIYSETLVFEQDELLGNWANILTRKIVYDEAIEKSQPPTPFKYNAEWECKNCCYKMNCDAIILITKKEATS